ncbi:MAG TPA: hypothetical protein VFX86_03960 [Candidatus Saccharimonadales bacterium]|nr:hypothetical protein [Candidatus Saccharimonadales bacterium]
MADSPSSKPKNQSKEPPAPEVLTPKADTDTSSRESSENTSSASKAKAGKHAHRTYRPSHKATFMGLAVVVAILLINSVIIIFVVKRQSQNSQVEPGQVAISQEALDKLGVKRGPIGDTGVELIVNPDARFNGKVRIGDDVSVGGQLILSKRLSAADASLTQLQAGKTSLSDLNVNGDGTVSNLNVRNDLAVAGTARVQGLAANTANISGNISIGGQLSVGTLRVSSLVSDSIIQLGGHFITTGSTPSVSRGSAAGSASISGNDSAGTVFVGVGAGGGSGTLATVHFRNSYSGTPRVVITPVGRAANVYVNSSSGSFSIGGSGLSAGGYSFNYIVMQ